MSLKAEVYTKLENSQFEQNIISGVSSREGNRDSKQTKFADE